jgi:hypothetical protein
VLASASSASVVATSRRDLRDPLAGGSVAVDSSVDVDP